MEPNTLLTGLQELFTNAIKAEVARHVEVNGNGTAIDKDKLHEAVTEALSNQDSDTNPCMDDVVRKIEGEFSEWFDNCMSDFDISDHVDVDDLVNQAVNEIDFGDKFSDYCYNGDIVSESKVEEMIDDSSGTGMSLDDANGMLSSVADGNDCNQGDAFRKAVLSIVNTEKLKSGSSVDDGTHMTVKATGSEREIQAILTRRRQYFERLHNALNALMGSAPNGDVPPTDNGEATSRWVATKMELMEVPATPDARNDQLWKVAQAATELLGLLSGLYHGETGAQSLQIAHTWETVLVRYRAKVKDHETDAAVTKEEQA